MSRLGFRNFTPILPAAIVSVVAMVLWFSLNRGHWQVESTATLAGWLLLLIILATIAAILTAHFPRPLSAQLSLSGALVIFLALFIASSVGLVSVLSLSALTLSWLALWSITAHVLQRFGPGISVGIPVTLSGLLMASPVIAIPLLRSAAHWSQPTPSPWQARLVEFVAHACPFFPTLDALRPAIRINWSTLPGMYEWSGLGQEIPMTLPNAWLCTGIYAGLAILVSLPAILYRLRRRRRRTSPRP